MGIKPKECETCGYGEEPTKECPSCMQQLCSDCHLAHAGDIRAKGECNPDLI